MADKVWQIGGVPGPGFVVSSGLVQARGYDLWTFGANCREVLPQVQENNWLDLNAWTAFTTPNGGGLPGAELARNRQRSEERRVGKEGRSRGGRYDEERN